MPRHLKLIPSHSSRAQHLHMPSILHGSMPIVCLFPKPDTEQSTVETSPLRNWLRIDMNTHNPKF